MALHPATPVISGMVERVLRADGFLGDVHVSNVREAPGGYSAEAQSFYAGATRAYFVTVLRGKAGKAGTVRVTASGPARRVEGISR